MPADAPQKDESPSEDPPLSDAAQFAKMAEDRQPGFFSEFWTFLRQNKKWWLTPILIVLFLLIALVIVSQTPLAPFIYPFF